ncbi:NADH:flavin oxidoreductase/NADH oxidase family protein [Altererythrobacter sp. TH136]|uniref:NADH:flavin oxidoreductase/NADH oxidase family protein n=1 Tax=Altererythrobacter sp. TH136 TaxID=2067415 RepID=UPI001164E9AB|nr:NADH:flavin oxidoreductase/NADH oxidase family protein [Altererythrobacter sp. TH136]QDM40622.1 NADH:flavin oxidoreductase/NADH oxidase family protein [Altererythrobacter sp. TH136]
MTSFADPLTLPNGQSLKNRLCKAAMTEGLADAAGRPSDGLIRLYGRWANGGIGLLLTGNIQVDRTHLERAGNVIIDREPDDLMRERLAAFAQAGKTNGTAMWAQLSHGGRQTPYNINPAPKAPSAVAFSLGPTAKFGQPVAMTADDIADVQRRFVSAAIVARDAGFDGVQVHGAHGYLLSSFLSPRTNKRDDQWGGTLENRAKLLLEIVRAVRSAVGDSFGVGVKLNSADFQRGGFDIEDSIKVAGWLDQEGIDLLEVSGGNYEAPKMAGISGKADGAYAATQAREAYFLEFAPRIRGSLKRTKLMVTGGFRSAAAMNAALAEGSVDLIGIARPLCAAPESPADLLSGKIDALPRLEQHLRLGPAFLGPKSRYQSIKALNAGGAQAWFCEQMVRLSEGGEPDRSRNILKAAIAYKKRDAAKAAEMDR